MLFLLLLVLSGTVLAANDPGHDTLYVLKLGDSNVTGSINLTANLTASVVKFTSKAFGSYLDIIANGSVFGATTVPRLMASSAPDMYLDSVGNLYVNTISGTSAFIQVGPLGGSNAITMNVSGQLLQQNVKVCLQNGTFCPGSLSSANITGSGAANYVTKWTSTSNLATSLLYDTGTNVGIGTVTPSEKLAVSGNASTGNLYVTGGLNASGSSYIAGSQICTPGNALCAGTGVASNAGWLNTTNQVFLANNNTNVTVDNGNLFIDNTNNRVGIGTTAPTQLLGVSGSMNLSGTAYIGATNLTTLQLAENGNLYYTDARAAASVQNTTLLRNSTNAAFNNLTANNLSVSSKEYIASTNLTSLQINENGNLYYTDARVASAIQNTTILRNGTNANFNTLNASALNVGTTNLTCSQVSGCVVGAAAGAGWLNTTNQVFLANNNTNLTVDNGNVFVDNTNNRVGIGTTSPSAMFTVNSSSAAGSFLVLNTTGSNHLFLNGSNGFVGVGTTAPSNTLTVNGTLNASGNVYDNANRVCTSNNGLCGSGGANVSGSGTPNYVARWSNTTSLSTGLLYDNGTNVGIGTTAPNAFLDVHGSTIINSSATTGSLQVMNGTGSVHLFVNGSGGNVGIGTVAPTQKLDVSGSMNLSGTAYLAATNLTSLQITENGNLYYTDARVVTAIQNTTLLRNGTNANFNTLNASTFNVGTTNLTCAQVGGCVVGAITSVPYQSGAAGWTNTTTQVFLANNNTNVTIDNGNLFLDNMNNRVGIGTTVPSATLDVRGTVMINSSSTSSFRIYNTTGSPLVTVDGTTGTAILYGPITASQNIEMVTGNISFDTGIDRTITVSNAATDTSGNALTILAGKGGTNGGGGGGDGGALTIGAGDYNGAAKSGGALYLYGGAGAGATRMGGTFIGLTSTSLARGKVGIRMSGTSTISMNGSVHIENETGTPLLEILGTGNVGIGTTNPTAKLVVSNGADPQTLPTTPGLVVSGTFPNNRIVATDANRSIHMSVTAVGGYGELSAYNWATTTAIPLDLQAYGGNVGIGTMTPGSTLSISGNISTSGTTNSSIDSGTLFIDSTDNRVGIGTTTPGGLLEIAGTSPRLLVTNTALSGNAGIKFDNSNGGTHRIWSIGGVGTLNSVFTIRDETSSLNAFVISPTTGYVGIGTTTPGYNLHVGDAPAPGNSQSSLVGLYSNTSQNYLEFGNTSSMYVFIKKEAGSTSNITLDFNTVNGVFASPYGGDYIFRQGTGGVTADTVTIKNSGYVGIGTAGPGQKLDVNGSIRVATLTAASATQVCRDGNNDLSTCSSSRKFKDNITYLTDADYEKILNDITNTHVATFTYKTDHPNMTRYGIIAEEAPTPLQYIDENGNNNIDFYSVETGYTWAGITAVHRENQALKTRVDTLETENHALRAAICRVSPNDPVCY